MKRLPLIAILALVLAIFLCYASFGHESADAYLFPQIIAGTLMPQFSQLI